MYPSFSNIPIQKKISDLYAKEFGGSIKARAEYEKQKARKEVRQLLLKGKRREATILNRKLIREGASSVQLLRK